MPPFGSIASGEYDVVVAGGVESMSRVPMGGNRDIHGKPFGWKLLEAHRRSPRAKRRSASSTPGA